MAEYLPVPVVEASRIADDFGKSMVVILAYDPIHQLTHTTTYGVSPADKELAATVGDACAKAICGEGFKQRVRFEDYRFIDEGVRTQALEKAIAACKGARHLCLSLLAHRTGATDDLIDTIRQACDEALVLAQKAVR